MLLVLLKLLQMFWNGLFAQAEAQAQAGTAGADTDTRMQCAVSTFFCARMPFASRGCRAEIQHSTRAPRSAMRRDEERKRGARCREGRKV